MRPDCRKILENTSSIPLRFFLVSPQNLHCKTAKHRKIAPFGADTKNRAAGILCVWQGDVLLYMPKWGFLRCMVSYLRRPKGCFFYASAASLREGGGTTDGSDGGSTRGTMHSKCKWLALRREHSPRPLVFGGQPPPGGGLWRGGSSQVPPPYAAASSSRDTSASWSLMGANRKKYTRNSREVTAQLI